MKNIIARNISAFLDGSREEELGRLLIDLHPADIAEVLESLDQDYKIRIISLLDSERASEVLLEMPETSRSQVMDPMSVERLSEIVSEMDSDDAADIVADLSEDNAAAVLSNIEPEDSAEVRQLLLYDEDTAGGIMQLELISGLENQNVAEAVEKIRSLEEEVEDLSYVFVVDRAGILRGEVSLKTLLLAQKDVLLKDLMTPSELVVRVHEDQEEVAQDFQKYDVRSAPVVDEQGKLLGRILVDDVFDVIFEEVDEDFYRMAGTSEEEIYSDRVLTISRLRLPWLLVNLAGGLVTGYLVWMFKVALQDVLALVTFIPAIMALGGSVGIQSSTIVVRSIALGRISTGRVGQAIMKEFKVALIMGLVCGLGGAVVARLWHGRLVLGLIVGLSILLAIIFSSILGAVTPAAFKRFNIDPALASGPFVTMCNDMLGIILYMGIATVFLKFIF